MTDVMVADRTQSRAEGKVNYYGVHHLALNTDDMKMTVEFYVGVLGMQLVHAMKVPPGLGTGPGNRGNPPFEEIRHYFFDMGCDGLLAFFEMPKGAKQRGDRNALGAMQHVSLAVSPESQARIRARLDAHKIPYDGPLEILPGFSRSTSSIRTTSAWSSVASRATAKASRASCRRSRRQGGSAAGAPLADPRRAVARRGDGGAKGVAGSPELTADTSSRRPAGPRSLPSPWGWPTGWRPRPARPCRRSAWPRPAPW